MEWRSKLRIVRLPTNNRNQVDMCYGTPSVRSGVAKVRISCAAGTYQLCVGAANLHPHVCMCTTLHLDGLAHILMLANTIFTMIKIVIILLTVAVVIIALISMVISIAILKQT